MTLLRRLRNFHAEIWLPTYLKTLPRRRRPRRGEPVHLLLCVVDHFEPDWRVVPPDRARARLERWVRDYPAQFGRFRDSDGRTPRHSFFYPIEDYEPSHYDALAGLCRAGFGEVEIHLHHKDDTAENLRRTLLKYRDLLVERHDLLARDRHTGAPAYAFIHGNWSLDNARPDGDWCGVNNELDVLRETGCYADFTLPSAPSATQTRKINSLYYAVDDPERPKSHDWGVDVGRGPIPDSSLMLIQGPLVLTWRRRKWGILPRLENSCLQTSDPPSIDRLGDWLRARVQVPSRPDWFFVKLHCHGGPEIDHEALLGEPMVRFHQALADRAQADPDFHFHYVTAREMYNLVKAAEAGWSGPVADARDYLLLSNVPCPSSLVPG
jgi:hypothetical protein